MHSLDLYLTAALLALAVRIGWGLGKPVILLYHTVVNLLPFSIAKWFWIE